MAFDIYPTFVECNGKTPAESFLHMVRLELGDIRKAFVSIGFRLNEANSFKYFEELGYTSIEELAEAEFGFKRSTTYNIMAISRRFGFGMFLRDEYRCFSYSQLVAMVPFLKYVENPYKICSNSRTVSEYKEFYNFIKNGGRGTMEQFFSSRLECSSKSVPVSLDITSDSVVTPVSDNSSVQISLSVSDIRNRLEAAFARDYTVIFNNDTKTGGLRVVPSAVVDIIFGVLGIEE